MTEVKKGARNIYKAGMWECPGCNINKGEYRLRYKKLFPHSTESGAANAWPRHCKNCDGGGFKITEHPPWVGVCEKCGDSKEKKANLLLICCFEEDGHVCEKGYHQKCLTPVQDAIPPGEWYCPGSHVIPLSPRKKPKDDQDIVMTPVITPKRKLEPDIVAKKWLSIDIGEIEDLTSPSPAKKKPKFAPWKTPPETEGANGKDEKKEKKIDGLELLLVAGSKVAPSVSTTSNGSGSGPQPMELPPSALPVAKPVELPKNVERKSPEPKTVQPPEPKPAEPKNSEPKIVEPPKPKPTERELRPVHLNITIPPEMLKAGELTAHEKAKVKDYQRGHEYHEMVRMMQCSMAVSVKRLELQRGLTVEKMKTAKSRIASLKELTQVEKKRFNEAAAALAEIDLEIVAAKSLVVDVYADMSKVPKVIKE